MLLSNNKWQIAKTFVINKGIWNDKAAGQRASIPATDLGPFRIIKSRLQNEQRNPFSDNESRQTPSALRNIA
jgi:hypothetical protein